MGDPIEQFLQSWKLDHTDARKNKLKQVLENVSRTTCRTLDGGRVAQIYHFEFTSPGLRDNSGQIQKIYVYHAPAQSIDAASVKWTKQIFDPTAKRYKPAAVTPRVVERYDFNQFAVTVLQSEFAAQGAVTIGDQTCHPYN
jgi:hypothetical protein